MKADLSSSFVLDEAFKKSAVRAGFVCSSEDIDKWAVGDCTETIALRQNAGRNLCDLIGTTHAGFYLLSHQVQEALHAARVTGWRACPTALKDLRGKLIDGYNAVGITGRCGSLDNTRSKKVTRILPSASSSADRWLGLYFPEETWDGADLFRPEGTMLTIVTLRAKEVIEATKATNIRFRRLLDVERMML
jgi:hypothetical protein